MKTVKPYIRLSEGVRGNKYYVTITREGEIFNKMYDTLEEAENAVFEIRSHVKAPNFDYPLDFIELLFGDDEKIDISYIEQHFDENIKDLLNTLTEREARIVTSRLIDGYTLEAVGLQEGVTRDRIRQIEAKAIRKLRHPSRLYIMRYGKEVIGLQDDIKKLTIELSKKKKELIDAINNPFEIELTEEEMMLSTLSQKIDNLDFSVRTFNCLRRGGIETLSQLVQSTVHDLQKLRNLGNRSLKEIIYKLNDMGLSLKEETEQDANERIRVDQMTLEEFYKLNESGTRVFKDGVELHIDQYTRTDLYTVIAFTALCDDLIKVVVE